MTGILRCDIVCGEALEMLRRLPPACCDALVTDPPAGISFMGKIWDHDHGGREGWVRAFAAIFRECLRVLKPGAHGLVWALPRTSHWTATALEDAGFEIRDVILHLFGQGFPKSLDVSKAIDKAAGAEREVVGVNEAALRPNRARAGLLDQGGGGKFGPDNGATLTAPATDAARQWAGWGTALKPAAEHWILVRKPLDGTVAANVLAHGTGALNIDGCRVNPGEYVPGGGNGEAEGANRFAAKERKEKGSRSVVQPHNRGRWPANVTLDDEAAALLDEQSGVLKSGSVKGDFKGERVKSVAYGEHRAQINAATVIGDTGGASRFFYCAKASKKDRNSGGVENKHPTVKPNALMRWLCRLIVPPGGRVLDCFMGSGSTGVAALQEGFAFVGIEREQASFETAQKRLAAAQVGQPEIKDEPEEEAVI